MLLIKFLQFINKENKDIYFEMQQNVIIEILALLILYFYKFKRLRSKRANWYGILPMQEKLHQVPPPSKHRLEVAKL